MSDISNYIYGWYDDATQPKEQPSCDPPHNGPCLYCGRPISADDVRTHSLMYVGQYAARSYFYRTHKSCDERSNSGGSRGMDGAVLDMILWNGD